MNNVIIFNVSLYIEDDFNYPDKIIQCLNSQELKKRKKEELKRFLEKKLSNRKNLEYLIEKNIMKKEDWNIRLNETHKILNNITYKNHYEGLLCHVVSHGLVAAAKKVDFILKKKLVNRLIVGEN
ncbi:hypothetical protein SLOPH_2198 [Spraguea lophii 42_110]|uniref:Uncharacterized protein n=1 Tax=Spraguea lophii (strain 42_110) TaxID=1358809 RepID=S7WAW6_SPRLO|nr:hypothetical protein SLOPH_2198 [Spraguea lophii 42_110]